MHCTSWSWNPSQEQRGERGQLGQFNLFSTLCQAGTRSKNNSSLGKGKNIFFSRISIAALVVITIQEIVNCWEWLRPSNLLNKSLMNLYTNCYQHLLLLQPLLLLSVVTTWLTSAGNIIRGQTPRQRRFTIPLTSDFFEMVGKECRWLGFLLLLR